MEAIIQTALNCGMILYGDYLAREIAGEPRNVADLLGSPMDISSFMGHYGEIPLNEAVHVMVIGGYTIRLYEYHIWPGVMQPVSCYSFYRTRTTNLGLPKLLNFDEVLEMTRQKKFRYIQFHPNDPGLNLVARGWAPQNGPRNVMKMYHNKIKLILHLGLGLPMDLVQKIIKFSKQVV